MRTTLPYYLGFSHCLGIGPMKLGLLLKKFGNIERAYKANRKELQEGLGIALSSRFIDFRNIFKPDQKLEEFKKKQIAVLTRDDKRFPKQLKEISDPPICLYVKGDIGGFDFDPLAGGEYFFAVVGTRKPTSYGKQIAHKLSFELATIGFIIVSGLAIGIDAIAHWAGLGVKAKTIAFLGCGVDIAHPPSNKNLYDEIIEKGGLVISEFPPGMTTTKGLFIVRNRLISGLSKGVLVIEGTKNSGALITARFGAEQGKEIFATPGPITSELSAAPNLLLKEGARLVTSVDDILQELMIKISPEQKKYFEISLDKDERRIVDLLSQEPRLTDEISYGTKISTSFVLQILSALEVKGVIEKNSEGKYQIR